MASEFESEREALATVTDLLLEIEKVRNDKDAKKEYSLDEISKFLLKYAEKRKIHK